jgi:hypothetical protein
VIDEEVMIIAVQHGAQQWPERFLERSWEAHHLQPHRLRIFNVFADFGRTSVGAMLLGEDGRGLG